ncbi:MAG: family 78 glycoside hydrolase catalytic domain, partial [Bacteroidales bacterium]|nr:family 78 glycoside hydrolase catalytic domain [Bacteroidales bacterium]
MDTLLQGAEWIAASEMLPVSDSLFYLDHPAPLFRKSFRITSPVVHAELVVATAGYQTVTLNGREIPGQYLSPAWTNYSKRIFGRKYDVTDWLLKGENVIGVELGNGWYNPLPLRMWGWLNLRDWLPVGQPRFILVLKVTGRNGQDTWIRSDSSWVWQSGPVIRNNVYLGTWYDARKEIDGWDTPGYSDTTWKHARIMTPPGGIIEEAFFPPIRKTATLKPVSIWQTESGSWIYDLGQNFAGWIHFHAPAQRGDTLIFRYGERIYPDSTLNPMTAVCGQIKRKGVGGPGAPDIAVQKDLYIASGAVADFEPRYTFHGFRYVEIQGLHLSPGKNILTGFRAGTDFQKAGSLKFNADWLNRIQTMVEWTLRSNYFSVPSDCPAREKFGYGGDMNQNAETFLYNFNMKSIYTKALYDWKDAMQPDGFVDTAPFVGIHYCGIAWEATFMLLQEWLYTFYGDTTLVADWYSYDREWMNKAENLLGNGLVTQGLSDHESLEPVPVELIGTVYYYKSLRIMEQFASLMHDDPGRQHYRQQAN